MYTISETGPSERRPLNRLTSEESALIAKIWGKWKDANTEEIVRFTHEQVPYKSTQDGRLIPYKLILKEDKSLVF